MWLPKPREVVEKLTGATPVPLNWTVWGEFDPVSFTDKIPVRVPRAVGVKVTEIVQLDPAANVLGVIGHFKV